MRDFFAWLDGRQRVKERWQLEKRFYDCCENNTQFSLNSSEEEFLAWEYRKIIPIIEWLKKNGQFGQSDLKQFLIKNETGENRCNVREQHKSVWGAGFDSGYDKGVQCGQGFTGFLRIQHPKKRSERKLYMRGYKEGYKVGCKYAKDISSDKQKQ
jgi:hypothetical protein